MSALNRELTELVDDLKTSWMEHGAPVNARIDQLDAKLDERVDDFNVRLQKVAGGRGLAAATTSDIPAGTNPFLSLTQRTAPHFPSSVESTLSSSDAADVRFGAIVAALIAGDRVREQLSEPELNAIGSSIMGPPGGYVVPEAIGSVFIDSVRPRLRVLQAGARTYPMEAPIVSLPGWDDLLTATWRGEGGAFTEATPDFRRVTLSAKSIAVRVRLPVELIEDSSKNLEPVVSLIEDEIGRAVAQGIDYAALLGGGTDNQPLGLMNVDTATGINEVSMGANGATPGDYDKFLDALYELEADSFEATAVLWHPRTPHTLSKIVTGISGDKTKLEPPPRIADLAKLPTTQIPITQSQGSATDASTAFFGDWSQLVIGFRPNMSLRALQDPYTEGKDGIINLYAYMRADVAALQPKAFCRLVGIKG